MADVKISALPAATTPLDGTELAPIVQSGTTKRVTVANLTVGRALTASSLTLTTPLSAANGGTGLTSLGTGIATFLGTPSSANLAAAVTDETGTGALVFGTTPTFTTSALFPAGTVSAPGISVSGDTNTGIYFPAADTIGFATNGAASMRLDASGNLGLGVTPSAWGGFKALQVIGGSIASSAGNYNNLIVGSNTFYDGTNYKYIGTESATMYRQTGGQHQWHYAASGTAGNAISFTQAMTLDASGNLGIGTSSPGVRVHAYNGTDNVAILASTDGATNKFGLLRAQAGTRSASVIQYKDAAAYFYCTNSDMVVGPDTANPILFQTNSAERARIDSSGNLLVGTTSVGVAKTTIYSATNTQAAIDGRITASGDVGTRALYLSKFDNDSTTSQILVQFAMNNGATGQGQINANGANTAAFGSYSDARLKKNIVDLPSQLSNILALRPREFDYIESEGGGHQIGFVAQEMQTVYPDAVGERADGMLTITAWSKTEARLVKAIQELAAKVTALEEQLNG
jgi:hypothetical protein